MFVFQLTASMLETDNQKKWPLVFHSTQINFGTAAANTNLFVGVAANRTSWATMIEAMANEIPAENPILKSLLSSQMARGMRGESISPENYQTVQKEFVGAIQNIFGAMETRFSSIPKAGETFNGNFGSILADVDKFLKMDNNTSAELFNFTNNENRIGYRVFQAVDRRDGKRKAYVAHFVADGKVEISEIQIQKGADRGEIVRRLNEEAVGFDKNYSSVAFAFNKWAAIGIAAQKEDGLGNLLLHGYVCSEDSGICKKFTGSLDDATKNMLEDIARGAVYASGQTLAQDMKKKYGIKNTEKAVRAEAGEGIKIVHAAQREYKRIVDRMMSLAFAPSQRNFASGMNPMPEMLMDAIILKVQDDAVRGNEFSEKITEETIENYLESEEGEKEKTEKGQNEEPAKKKGKKKVKGDAS